MKQRPDSRPMPSREKGQPAGALDGDGTVANNPAADPWLIGHNATTPEGDYGSDLGPTVALLRSKLAAQTRLLAQAQGGARALHDGWELSSERQARILEGGARLALLDRERDLRRTAARSAQRLQADVSRLTAQVASQQKARLELERRLDARTRELEAGRDAWAELKTRNTKLALEVEASERTIWRMASQLEVGTHSALAKWSSGGVVAGLEKRLEEHQAQLRTAQAERDKHADGERAATSQLESHRRRADDAEAARDASARALAEANRRCDALERKWEARLRKELTALRKKHAAQVAALEEAGREAREAHEAALEASEAEHEATRALLAEEREAVERATHKLSACEVTIGERESQIDELEQVIAAKDAAAEHAERMKGEALKKAEADYLDVKARLNEAVTRNELREDAFSRNWTASQWRTAMSAGEPGG